MSSEPDSPEPPSTGAGVPPAAAWEQVRAGAARLIDVRTPQEFARAHARGAAYLPLDRLDPQALFAKSDSPVLLICRAGTRSREAADRIRAASPAAPVAVVAGGTLAWRAAGLPVVYGRRRWRRWGWKAMVQVGVVAVSVLLAVFVHKGLLGIVGLVGAWAVVEYMLLLRHWRALFAPDDVAGASPD